MDHHDFNFQIGTAKIQIRSALKCAEVADDLLKKILDKSKNSTIHEEQILGLADLHGSINGLKRALEHAEIAQLLNNGVYREED